MNKQEAIEQLDWNVLRTTDFDRAEDVVMFEKVKYIISQIHEPQKVVVPKHVAEWIEYCKSNELTLLGAFDPVSEHGIGLANTFTGEVWKGVDWAKRNQETFARAWLDGFEIEQEKLYTVEIPNPNLNAHTILQKKGKGLALVTVTNARWRGWADSKLTESEIKENFEWAWQWAEPVEVENDDQRCPIHTET